MKKLFIYVGLAVSLAACNKIEGEGGQGEISGKLEINQILYVNSNPAGNVAVTAAAEDVYIVYGTDDEIYDDKIETNYDGTFKFKYLRPGTYTVFAYSEIFSKGANVTNNDDDYYYKVPVKVVVTVDKKGSVDVGTLSLTR
jgi:hypothetical protein